MDRPRRDSRQQNGIMLQGLSQLTFATKSALFGLRAVSAGSPKCAQERTSTKHLDDAARQHALSEFTRQARQQVDAPDCLDRLFCARAVPMIPILLTVRCAAPGSVHPADAKAAYRGGTTWIPRSFRFGFAARRVVGALHGVDGHFDLVPPPTPTGSGCLVSLRIGIGASELAASRAGDTLRAPPVVKLSAMIA
jgi:hypothetical protein